MIVLPASSEAENNRRKWTIIPVWFLHVHRLTEGARNSSLNEVWEFFVDFNYPSQSWTSLAHIVENRLYIRTTGIPSWEAVPLVLLIPHSLKTHLHHLSNTQCQELGRNNWNSSVTVFPVISAYMGAFVSYYLCIFYNMWLNNGNMIGLAEILILPSLEHAFLTKDNISMEVKIVLWAWEKPGLQWFVTLHIP